VDCGTGAVDCGTGALGSTSSPFDPHATSTSNSKTGTQTDRMRDNIRVFIR
jgi:hypothetical protein